MKPLVNFKKLIIRLWISLWLILVLMLVLKYCFNMWYPIVIENKTILKFCSAIDNNQILFIAVSMVFYTFSATLTYLTCIKKSFKDKTLFIMPVCFMLTSFTKHFIPILGTILEIIFLIIVPIIYNIIFKTFRKMYLNILFPIVVNIIMMIWQLNIFLIRGISNVLTDMPAMISLVLQFDYYIFLIITWIGVYFFMGVWGPWFFNRPLTELKAMREAEAKKQKPNQELIRQLDEAIKNKEEEEE